MSESSESTARLRPGDPAPEFTLTAADGSDVGLGEVLAAGGKRVVLYFYPAAMTPGCTTEACDFRDNLRELEDAGVTVLGVSPDSPEKLARFREQEGLTFPLLSDPGKEVLRAYGAFGEKKNYGRVVQGVIRSTFVIDPDGTVAKAFYNVKATGHVERVKRELGLA
ncbi:thioredoxin-dependent thiol peroxidase [Streptomonospora wellingtoniae]|uniref:thioredoxin-dependent peroxiredoxin n=1 Tax=Streptomonospora wellingtoniae TaxID=3075544 RepID=A0ABU2KQK3_9ACTN|nr:thioredoxin-dependent thiol peroxidase [Streptomonospora sp. DSM 45055]MDT0301570.1 thioredoxin-dependent thiol peroxidase [Streptomonospora sp. DSM 45055]